MRSSGRGECACHGVNASVAYRTAPMRAPPLTTPSASLSTLLSLSLSLSLSCSLALSVSPVFRAYYSGLHRVCFRDKKWTFASIYADTTHLLTGAEAAADTATTET